MAKTLRIASWNVNGIRAASQKGLLEWINKTSPDIFCLQEIKAFPAQVEPALRSPPGYKSIWMPAKKPGYSGVATYFKKDPVSDHTGIGISKFDDEGRVLVTEFESFTLINTYFPNSQRDHARLPYKLEFCDEIEAYCVKLSKKGKTVIICGDLNIAHEAIDLKNPKTNEDNAGYLPEERKALTQFLNRGFVDTFRSLNPEPGNYSWWSYRPGVREKNIGWRLDYHLIDKSSQKRLKKAWIEPEVFGSDHCPVWIELQ